MKLGKQDVSIKSLIRPNWLDTECRVSINNSKVQQYACEIMEGANFPEPVCFYGKDQLTYVGDGFHRILARKLNGNKTLCVELRLGGRREAILHGIDANREQRGLPFGRGDKEKAILLLLQDEECRKWNQTRISEFVGSSVAYVSQVRSKYGHILDRPDVIIDRNGIVRSMPTKSKGMEETAKRRDKVISLFAEGVPKIEISRRLDLPRWSVQQYVRQAQQEAKLVDCPHCHGTGKIKSLEGKK